MAFPALSDCRIHADRAILTPAGPTTTPAPVRLRGSTMPVPPAQPTPPAPEGAVPGTAALRATMLWAARSLAGAGSHYPGPITVKVTAPEEGLSFTVVPKPGADGMDSRASLAVIAGDTASRTQAQQQDLRERRLLGAFLSKHERIILGALARLQPAKAADVLDACRGADQVEKSKFWVLWPNLQQRGLVVDGDDGGFVLADEWVRELLEEGQKGPT